MAIAHIVFAAHLMTPAAVAPPAHTIPSLTAAAHRAALALELPRRQPAPRPAWIKRHPVLTGAAAGFTAGYLIGYLPGDDAVFDDFDATFNGLVLGGVGAGVGALIGWLIAR